MANKVKSRGVLVGPMTWGSSPITKPSIGSGYVYPIQLFDEPGGFLFTFSLNGAIAFLSGNRTSEEMRHEVRALN